MIATIDWNSLLQSIGTLIAAIAAIIAAMHSNQAKNNTTTPSGEQRNLGTVVSDVETVVDTLKTPPTTGAK